MGQVYFYHLTRQPLEVTLPLLLQKARGAGWCVAVRGVSAGRLHWLDEKLWTTEADMFLPHGLAEAPHAEDQPILLTTGAAANAADCVMAIDGAEITVQEIASLERSCILFDGHDPEALQLARRQWKTLTDAGAAAQYWSEESGRWEKKAEKNTG